MILKKSVLLGSAAVLMMGGVAAAADLPVRKAAPVDYVRVCDFTGAGFFYIPGTDTCIQFSGIMRVDYAFINTSRAFAPAPGAFTAAAPHGTILPGRDRDGSGFRALTRFGVDTRTQTAYGTLRTFIQYQIERDQGNFGIGGLSGGQTTFANQGGNNAALRRGFIQFAGITAGRVQSFFDFYADNYNYEGIANSDLNNIALAYTYTMTGGYSATLALEDRNQRNLGAGLQNIGNIVGAAPGQPNYAVATSARYGGETIPDIVGVLRTDQSWGAAQLSAAYHDITTNSGPFAGSGGNGFFGKDTDGFAVQGGLRVKLPMLAAGDDLWLEGVYQRGAYLYMDSGAYMNASSNAGLAAGGFLHVDHDAIAYHLPGAAPGTFQLATVHGFSALFAFNHYFTPNFHDVIFGSYEQDGYGKRIQNIDWTLGGIGNASEYRLGNQFLWDPVKNLEFGLEFDYIHIDQTLAHNLGQTASAIPVGVDKNPTGYEVRLRAERDF